MVITCSRPRTQRDWLAEVAPEPPARGATELLAARFMSIVIESNTRLECLEASVSFEIRWKPNLPEDGIVLNQRMVDGTRL
jgi:hypothetical protein